MQSRLESRTVSEKNRLEKNRFEKNRFTRAIHSRTGHHYQFHFSKSVHPESFSSHSHTQGLISREDGSVDIYHRWCWSSRCSCCRSCSSDGGGLHRCRDRREFLRRLDDERRRGGKRRRGRCRVDGCNPSSRWCCWDPSYGSGGCGRRRGHCGDSSEHPYLS